MDVVMIKTLQLILSLSILVVLHEGGHFLFSKLFGVRVEKFFLFFDPWFHLFSTKDNWFTRLFPKFKKKETEYGVGWLPLGGYVKIAGMIDESMDTEQMKQPVQSWEFRAKPAWQRLLIMVGGVLVNFLLAFFIYIMILFAWGDKYTSVKDMKYGFQFNEQAEQIGFRDGDILLATDGEELVKWDGDVYRRVSEAHEVTVLRAGEEVRLIMPEDMDMLAMLQSQPPFLMPYLPAVVDSVLPETPAERAGLQKGDRFVEADGVPVATSADFSMLIQARLDSLSYGTCTAADSLSLRQLTLVYQKAGSEFQDTVTVELTETFKIGVAWPTLMALYKPVKVDYGFWESIPAGISYGWNVFAGYVSDLQYLFTPDGAKSMGSFITIGSIFPATWDWYAFWHTTAFLSLILAFMNILPIPALDGGHVMFLLIEIITRRPPSEKVLERAQIIGMTLLFALMALAFYNDIMRWVVGLWN